ncbi:GNAT family N-acetyltransferase [Glaciecola sp. 1036]|uniref:GNAT family N-acetyltransferase n=1 Tax=Alteromonadaceae TaxID=72275 RepID=UPI003D0809D6
MTFTILTTKALFSISLFKSIQQLLEQVPDASNLLPAQDPFVNLTFLELLEKSQSVGGETGWQPNHFGIWQNQSLIALIPCYEKYHSYGEYVFDHAWANAYHQHGLEYYPKLLCAIPFTPVTLNKMLLKPQSNLTEEDLVNLLSQHWLEMEPIHSSFHALFIPENQRQIFSQHDFHTRLNVQFVFNNQDYGCFDNFLDDLKSRKRKSIRKERNEAVSTGVNIKRFSGKEITPELMDDFYLCYQATYLKRSGHTGYLTEAFFKGLVTNMRDHIMLVMAFKNHKTVAGALFFFDNTHLYGRYWGALEDISQLHFECCYYQGIEFTIEKGLQYFNPGTQGEHKIARGFRPTLCYSMHKMRHPAFDDAVKDFTEREAPHMLQYYEETQQLLPFKLE